MDLPKDWFDPISMDRTIINLIKSCDKEWLRTVNPGEFVDGLINEIIFLSVYDRADERRVAEYIRRWSSYFYAQAIIASRQE